MFIEPFSFFSIIGGGIDLDYCDIEWFALEKNRNHAVIFETAFKYCISDSIVDWLDLLAVQGTFKSLLQHHSSKASI